MKRSEVIPLGSIAGFGQDCDQPKVVMILSYSPSSLTDSLVCVYKSGSLSGLL
jgi:hypothetical protein